MNPVLVGLCTTFAVAGLLVLLDGASSRVRQQSTGRSTRLWTTVDIWWSSRSTGQRVQVVASFLGGIAVFALSGWVVALAAVPLLCLGLPALLAEPDNRDIEVLEALDRWVRGLVASLPTGKSIPDAMRSTAAQAPELLREPVHVMITRLDARWTSREALLALADDLDCPEADAVIAALVLAAQRGGAGAVVTLRHLADTIQTRLRALREIEAERAKPRVVVRQVTVISLVVLVPAMLLRPEFFRPYHSPVGQVLLATWIAAYVGALVVMRRITIPRRRERIIVRRVVTPLAGGRIDA